MGKCAVNIRDEALTGDNNTYEVNDDASNSGVPRRIGLEYRVVGEALAVDALSFHATPEADVCHADSEPTHQAGYGGHVDEPVEDTTGAIADGHVRQQAEERVHGERYPWETPAINAREDFGRVAVDGETVCRASA